MCGMFCDMRYVLNNIINVVNVTLLSSLHIPMVNLVKFAMLNNQLERVWDGCLQLRYV